MRYFVKITRLRTLTTFILCMGGGILAFTFLISQSDYYNSPARLKFSGKKYLLNQKHAKPDNVDERIKRVGKMCREVGKVSGKTNEISGIRSNNFSYCVVQKAGCTMWIRLFKYMEGQNYDTGNPMTLNKRMIHLEMPGLYKRFSEKDTVFIEKSLRTMTVRDPYTRLWSAYIDKFVLLDFWATKGKHIVKMIRQNPSKKALECGHDVTFQEFVQYVINIGHQFRYINQDKHWLPASDICDPCTFEPDIIGKQETFMDDFAFTLERIKLEYMLPNITSVNPTEFEIKDEIDYNFRRFLNFEACVSKCELGARLWTAFTYNGYVPPETTFSLDTCSETMKTVETYYKLVDDVRKKYNYTNEMKKANRKRFISEAYKQLSAEQIEKLKRLYRMDFAMFGYKSNPEYLNTSGFQNEDINFS